jgi:hypothetical protein
MRGKWLYNRSSCVQVFVLIREVGVHVRDAAVQTAHACRFVETLAATDLLVR